MDALTPRSDHPGANPRGTRRGETSSGWRLHLVHQRAAGAITWSARGQWVSPPCPPGGSTRYHPVRGGGGSRDQPQQRSLESCQAACSFSRCNQGRGQSVSRRGRINRRGHSSHRAAVRTWAGSSGSCSDLGRVSRRGHSRHRAAVRTWAGSSGSCSDLDRVSRTARSNRRAAVRTWAGSSGSCSDLGRVSRRDTPVIGQLFGPGPGRRAAVRTWTGSAGEHAPVIGQLFGPGPGQLVTLGHQRLVQLTEALLQRRRTLNGQACTLSTTDNFTMTCVFNT